MLCLRTPWEVVNGMWSAPQRGHGWVSTYLRQVGVPRSTAYRWEQELRWLVSEGRVELGRLRGKCARLSGVRREVERQGGTLRGMSREQERAFILEAAVLGMSDGEIAGLLGQAGGRWLSHETINGVIAEAGRCAREVFERYFAGRGEVVAAEEIFLGRRPLMLMVEPRSLAPAGQGPCEPPFVPPPTAAPATRPSLPS